MVFGRRASNWRLQVLSSAYFAGFVDPTFIKQNNESEIAEVIYIQNYAQKVLRNVRMRLRFVFLPFESNENIFEWLCAEEDIPEEQQQQGIVDSLLNSAASFDDRVSPNELRNIKSMRQRNQHEEQNALRSLFMDIVEFVVIDFCRLWLQSNIKDVDGHFRLQMSESHQPSEDPAWHSKLISNCCLEKAPLGLDNKTIAQFTKNQSQCRWDFTGRSFWCLNQKTLRRIVALSCASGSQMRDRISSLCSDVFEISLFLFRRIIQSFHQLFFKPESLFHSPSDNFSTIPSESVSESDQQQHQIEPPAQVSLYNHALSATPDVSDLSLISVLDYAFHILGVDATLPASVSSDSDATNLNQPHQQQGEEVQRLDLFNSQNDDRTMNSHGCCCTLPHLLYSCLNVVSGDKSLIVLVSGASGCGKSTLSCLLANRLGLGTVLSTDTIRHILRSTYSQQDNPLLYASTYETGRFISNEELLKNRTTESVEKVCAALMRSNDNNRHAESNNEGKDRNQLKCSSGTENAAGLGSTSSLETSDSFLQRRRVLEGYLQQSEMLYDRIEFIISQLIMNGESLVVEGVHLTMDFMRRVQSRFPGQVVPFLVFLSNEETHVDRFASRSRNFNTEPTTNKYIEYLENIRTIQRYLTHQAENDSSRATDGTTSKIVAGEEEEPVVIVDNTSISVSIRLMHNRIVEHLRRRGKQTANRIKQNKGQESRGSISPGIRDKRDTRDCNFVINDNPLSESMITTSTKSTITATVW